MGSEDRMAWEREVLAGHRWGRHGEDTARAELDRLHALYETAAPLDPIYEAIAEQIVALEICNWRLEASIIDLSAAIGAHKPVPSPIGHKASVTDERWREIWAYYLVLRNWLPGPLPPRNRGYRAILDLCDPGGSLREKVETTLGEKTELKQLYVELFCLRFQEMIEGDWGNAPPRYVQAMANWHAREQVVDAIEGQDGDEHIVNAITRGNFQPCHHKVFRHLDIVLSSIGTGEWRRAMPCRGTDGFAHADRLGLYLAPLAHWLEGAPPGTGQIDVQIHRLLGQRDEAKVFLVALLVSLLRAQQQSARQRAERAARTA